MAKGYIIGHIKVRDPEPYMDYARLNTTIIEGFGGRFIVRGGACEMLEGEAHPRHVVIEFPDYSAAVACFRSPAYQRVAEIRRAHAESVFVVAEGQG